MMIDADEAYDTNTAKCTRDFDESTYGEKDESDSERNHEQTRSKKTMT